MTTYFDEVQTSYEAADLTPEGVFWRTVDLTRIQAYLPHQRSTLLDLGCGNGFYSAALAGTFTRTVLIDISMRMLITARRRTALAEISTVSLLCADMVALPLRSEPFVSLVLGTGATLCYVRQIVDVVSTLTSLLRPQGRVFLEFWSKAGLLLDAAHNGQHGPFRELSAACASGQTATLTLFAQTGETNERANLGTADIAATAYTSAEVLSLLRQAGLAPLAVFGRKAVYALYKQSWIAQRIRKAPRQLAALEMALAAEPALIDLCPKFVVIAERDGDADIR